jgi:hypothetical protein
MRLIGARCAKEGKYKERNKRKRKRKRKGEEFIIFYDISTTLTLKMTKLFATCHVNDGPTT